MSVLQPPSKSVIAAVNTHHWTTGLKLALAFYLPVALGLSVLAYGLLRTDVNVRLQKLQAQETAELKIAEQLLVHDFENATSDLQFLAQTPALKHFINAASKAEKQRVTELFFSMAQTKQRYDQIRFIDNSGIEKIRVNLVGKQAVTVPDSGLQNKSERYFFREMLHLGAGETYTSPLDLSIEYGQIETPYKPILRFGTPLFNRAGKKQGFLMFSYLGQELLDDFPHAMRDKKHAMLLNRDGYWLSNPDPALEWGFMFGRDDTFGKYHPDAWATISTVQQGSMLTAKGLYTFITVHPPRAEEQVHTLGKNTAKQNPGSQSAQDYYLKIVSLIPAAELPAMSASQYPFTFALFMLSLVLLALLALYLASTILGRRQLRAAVFESEAQLKQAQRLAQLGSWEQDLTTKKIIWSDEIYRIFETDPSTFSPSYEAFMNLVHPQDRERVNLAYTETVQNRASYNIEHRLLLADGRIKHVIERGEILYDSQSRPLRTIGTVQDISERKLAEEARLRAETLFQMVFNNVADAIVIHDFNGHYLEANRIFCERMGYSCEELLQLSPAAIHDPEGAAQFSEHARELKEKGQLTCEMTHISREGRRIPVEVSARLIEYQGKPATLSVIRDISERKATQEALRSSAETARALLNATTESAILIDAAGTVLAINKVGAKRLRKRSNEIVGRNVLELLPAEIAANRKKIMQEVVLGGQPSQYQDELNGIHFDHSLYPIFDAHGKVSHIAIYSADISERIKLQAEETLLHHIDQQVLRSHSLPRLLQFVCDEIVQLFGYHFAWLGKKEANGEFSIAAQSGNASDYLQELLRIGVRWDDTPQGKGPAGSCIRTGKLQVFKISDSAYQPWYEATVRFGFQSVVAIPLIVRGQVYGALMLYAQLEQDFDEPVTRQRLSGIASRICVALETAMDQEQLRLLSTALEIARNGVFITDALGRILWVNNSFTRLTGYSSDEAIGNTPALLHSGKQDAAYYQRLWQTIQQGKTWINETVERHKSGKLFTVQQTITPIKNDIGTVSHFVSVIDDITVQKEAAARIQYMAHFDALTDLPNRALFLDRLHQILAQSKRNDQTSALLFLDLDRFKAVNDTLGHHVGDLLLQAVADRLKACVRETDTVSRLAGDEFTVLLSNVRDREDAALIAEKITAALAAPFSLEGHEVNIGSSTGIAFYPADADSDEALIKCADHAMYVAKEQGRGTFRFYQAPLPVN
jgi:diguanylate cyclase (GGDEF)-like protein/PAS domain S-box-containing protein